jgi:large subunit ribosomal protein L19
MADILSQLENEGCRTDLPEFRTGDTVTVNVKVIEGNNKERIQAFKGIVIQRKNHGIAANVTVRKMSGNIAVERIFPIHSPSVASIEVNRKGQVRQSRIFYMRDLRGKAARIKERKEALA